jgi:DUF1009 family protein
MGIKDIANERIGILAGWGRYPIVVAEALRNQGARVFGLGVKDHVDPVFAGFCEGYQQIGVAKLGAAVRFYRRHNVTKATMAGKLHKTLLFKKFYWLKHVPDPLFVRTFYPHFITMTRDRKDDTILGTIVDAFAERGIHFAPATDFAPELLVKHGMIAGRHLTRGQMKDVEFGWQLASEMGRLDVGQSVCVKGRAVLAVEAVEGTDECIRRAGKLCPAGGFSVIKIAKPQQDMRFDVPTIGIGTIETMKQAGAKVLAVQANKTILLDRESMSSEASRLGIQIVAVEESSLGSKESLAA